MDPCRIRSYLQVACAGLGFEIGEIWWTANKHGSSTVAAIGERQPENGNNDGALVVGGQKKLRFVQLYTSKSYANRRSMLVTPPEDDDDEQGYDNTMLAHHHHHDHECTKDDLEKHKLSPRLVDAISKTAQVVWANTLKREGLTGRSDIPLHTAVGMPVALDADGNMCVVVMFSPNNIQSTDEAMEYLQSISRSATSSSIPCLMPAFSSTEDIQHVPAGMKKNNAIRGHLLHQEASLGEGVTARFVSIDDEDNESGYSTPAEIRGHDLSHAPKDCFGIPMLPSLTEFGSHAETSHAHHTRNSRASPTFEEVFDEASFGVWSTIMQDRSQIVASPAPIIEDHMDFGVDNGIPVGLNEGVNPAEDDMIDPKTLVTTNKRNLDSKRKERLEEFCSAFLGMSVFDIADVWIPAGPEHPDCLSHVVSISSSNQSNAITEFKRVSGYTLIKFWSGAVGRAYSSGNPVWSCNPDVYIDKGRSHVFERANIMTAFSVPILSGKKAVPVGVVCCYSMIQSGSVPFVLKFVQQALHLLWSGLDKVQPHESVGQQMWQDVGPADLGEMAADVEMQQHFFSKKRPRQAIEHLPQAPLLSAADRSAPLSTQFRTINFRGLETVQNFSTIMHQEEEDELIPEVYNLHYFQDQLEKPPEQRVSVQAMQAFQNHIKEAVRQVGDAMPFMHAHVATTVDGRKRAHVTHHQPHVMHHHQPPKPRRSAQPAPLAMPHALPTQVVKASHYTHNNEHGAAVGMHNHSPQYHPSSSSPSPTYQSQSHAPPPMPAHASTSPAFTQYTGSHLRAENLVPQAGPSQNLLSQDILDSIDSDQYQFQYEAEKSGIIQAQNHEIYYSPPTPPASVAVMNLASGTAEQMSLISDELYCVPTESGYPAPDSSSSEDGITSVTGSNGKLCRIQGCDDPAVIRRPYCVRHSGNRLCEHHGCNKCAQGSTRFCIAHGGGRRCTFQGCDKGARDKFFCAAHGGGKRCKADGCNKSAVGGSSLCTAHGGGRRCAIDGCDKSAQSSTKFCVKHGGGKKCLHEGCEKVARGRTQYCAAHGGGVRCKLEGCNRVAIGKMQLCRAHGGGSRGKGKNRNNTPSPAAVAPICGIDVSGRPMAMDYSTPTTV